MSEREDMDAMAGRVQAARDHAHWLAVHRRQLQEGSTAKHLEALLDLALRMTWDLQGQVARAEASERPCSCETDERYHGRDGMLHCSLCDRVVEA